MSLNVEVDFDLVNLLATTANGTKRMTFRESETIFAQGDNADSAFYIEHGAVKKTYVSREGKERIVGLLKARDFFGVGCLTGRQKCGTTAVAMTDCSVIRIEKRVMLQLLSEQPKLADLVITFLVEQAHRYEKDLVDHLFNPSEKRLARTLLMLSDLGESDGQKTTLPSISQETLANIVGTTRSRINYFMNKFRQQGVIEYDGRIRVINSRLSAVLDDQTGGQSKRQTPDDLA
jgi:CRP-like cAMP-binding protein